MMGAFKHTFQHYFSSFQVYTDHPSTPVIIRYNASVSEYSKTVQIFSTQKYPSVNADY